MQNSVPEKRKYPVRRATSPPAGPEWFNPAKLALL